MYDPFVERKQKTTTDNEDDYRAQRRRMKASPEHVDPFAERRQKTTAEKEDEYRAQRRRLIISPERIDPFAEGLYY